ncbi:unnamed protein product [Urochloa humidicola]
MGAGSLQASRRTCRKKEAGSGRPIARHRRGRLRRRRSSHTQLRSQPCSGSARAWASSLPPHRRPRPLQPLRSLLLPAARAAVLVDGRLLPAVAPLGGQGWDLARSTPVCAPRSGSRVSSPREDGAYNRSAPIFPAWENGTAASPREATGNRPVSRPNRGEICKSYIIQTG